MKTNLSGEEFENDVTAYALGALSAQEARAFEDTISLLSEDELTELEELKDVAALMAFDSISAVPAPCAKVKEKLFERINAEKKKGAKQEDPSIFVIRSNDGEWTECGGGISVKRLFADSSKKTVTSLMKMKPGAMLPKHKHIGVEECYLLEGDIKVSGESYEKGDYLCALPNTIHEPLSTVGGALLLLIAPETYELVPS